MGSMAGNSVFVATRPTRVLSNSAAEFVETRAGAGICRRATGDPVEGSKHVESLESALAGVRFVPQLDRFMPENEAPEETSYYQESEEMLEKFKESLKNFTQILQSRSVFKKLGIEAPDPAKFDLNYVLKIAALIQEHQDGSEDTQIIKKFARKCFRGAAQNKAAITALLSMIPNDVYGSVISGGFSLILAAVENHENNRAEIQSALADIPRKLETIQRSFEIRIRWPSLHRCANQILLAIFVVLERIIDKLSLSTFQKGVYKVKGRGSDIKEAIDSLGERIKDFQEEANTCSLIMLGRTHDRVQNAQIMLAKTDTDIQNTQVMLTKTDTRVQHVESKLDQAQEALASKLDEIIVANQTGALAAQQDTRQIIAHLFNNIYATIASAGIFNAADGTLNRREMEPTSASAPKRTGSGVLFSLDKSKELVDTWLSGLGDFDPMPEAYINECLSSFPRMSPKEMDRAQWIMASDKVDLWLAPAASRILDLHSETAPEEQANALSFTAATLAFSLARAADFPVISYFCRTRAKGNRSPADSSVLALWNSLNGQLLKFMIARRQTADLSFLGRSKLITKSQTKPKYAAKLFAEVLAALPEKDALFIIIDSFSHFASTGTDVAKGNELLSELAALTTKLPQLVIKLLVTDALPSCQIRKLSELTLRIPDDVDGWQSGISWRHLEERKTTMIGQFVKRREQSSNGESGLESSSDSESE
ncbi:hypothetical protein B0T24DRAFT_580206 [Lasiosphaeria ovina]|uniref:Fungal STAND N-terminal Goodbye domain-containing protein n=1 Tax=Lasiosphaeria ovina TaxID=92902 RepID=A0AAE0N3E5_9PEZI|nr:hypothetical protein B0T24DRAFT_580206 [Lasiosphaeria ovina]